MTKRLFFIILGIGLLGSLFSPDIGFSAYENRFLSKAPSFSVEALTDGNYTAAADDYLHDQFFFRNDWIRLKTQSDKDLFRKKAIHDVYLGKSGYLLSRYTEKDIDPVQVRQNIAALQTFQQSYGAFVILIPTASEVLTDKLPSVSSHLDQSALLNGISSSPDADAILKQHASENIFYKTDHHWTLRGAYLVYEQFAGNPLPYQTETVSEDFQGTLFKKLNLPVEADSMQILSTPNRFQVVYDNAVTSDSLYEAAHLSATDQYSYYLDGNHGLTEITNLTAKKDSVKESLLIVKDSFANTFATLICNNYRKVYLIDLRYYNGNLASFVAANQIEDTLFLYNNINFMQDKNLSKLPR